MPNLMQIRAQERGYFATLSSRFPTYVEVGVPAGMTLGTTG